MSEFSEKFFYPHEDFSLAGKTLVVPIVSTANVAQLAVDLLISSLGLHRIGVFDPQHVVPVVGAPESEEEGLTVPLELYGKRPLDVVFIQQRSPALKSRKLDFVQALLTFIRRSGFAAVLLLSGVDRSMRTDAQMLTPTHFVIPPNSPELASTPLGRLFGLPIPAYTSQVHQHLQGAVAQSQAPFIPGGGLTRRILSSLDRTWSVPMAALLQFVIEGDNEGDALLLAGVTVKVLGIDTDVKEWKRPATWRRGLFGKAHDQTLYG